MLRLAAEWTGRPRLSVLTVDHGLRATSAQEAAQVAAWAAQAGLAHVTLNWTSAKPQSGIQAKARAARYDLMSSWCRDHNVEMLLTAHTLEDQAETVLMRMARTASLDSLAGIPRFGQWNTTELFRPLLAEKRLELRAYLASLDQMWIDDPSNDDDRFERVRIRKAMPALAQLGITAEALAELAGRAAEAVHALWGAAEDWIRLHVQEFDTGHCIIALAAFTDLTAALQTRILGGLISRYGSGKIPEPVELEVMAAWAATAGNRRTLGGAIVARRKNHLLIGREPGRINPAAVRVPETGVVLWDDRFEIHAEAGSSVIPVACAGIAGRRRDIPSFVQQALPAIIRGGKLISAPHLAPACGCTAVFLSRLRR